MAEFSPITRETGVQSQVESYQRLKMWYLIPPCLTLSIIRYLSKVKWSNPGKEVALYPTPMCSSYWKGSFRVALDYGCQIYFTFIYIYRLNNKDTFCLYNFIRILLNFPDKCFGFRLELVDGLRRVRKRSGQYR